MTVETTPASPKMSMTSTIIVDTAAIATDLDGEVIILDTAEGVYFGLSEVGASIWNLIQQPKTLAEVRDAITQEYDVSPEVCEREVTQLVQSLVINKLVKVAP